MKKYILKVAFLLAFIVTFFAQQSLAQTTDPLWETSIRYNCATSRYEVYGRPTQNRAPTANILASTITVILPLGNPQLTRANITGLESNFPRVPASFTETNDWARSKGTLGSNGYYVTIDNTNGGSFESNQSLVGGKEYLLFTFLLTGGCTPGLRLWQTGDDIIILSSDYKTTIKRSPGNLEQFINSYNNAGTICGVLDFGDLAAAWPQPKATNISYCDADNNGIPDGTAGAVWAGSIVDGEGVQLFSTVANGDNNSGLNDEDGFFFPNAPISAGFTSEYNLILNSNMAGKRVYYGVWFDWDNNGSFTNDFDPLGNPAFYSGSAVTMSPVSVSIPVKTASNYSSNFKVRVIVSDVAVTSTMFGDVIANGEIEDYQAPPQILPVTFGTIAAEAKNCNVYLNFDYLTEQNNRGFEVEYSTNGTVWTKLAALAKTGNNGTKKYSYQHTNPAAGANYYRIKQIDFDGNFSYSKTVVANSTCEGKIKITTYPNPVQNNLTIILPAGMGKSQLRITDAVGKLISSISTLNTFNNINTQLLAPGIYLVEVITDNKTVYTKKFVKE